MKCYEGAQSDGGLQILQKEKAPNGFCCPRGAFLR